MNTLFSLFSTFFKIGCISFGGGLAMLPMLQAELCDRRHWLTTEELSDQYALSQCTPGAIAVNLATYVGYIQHGVSGGIIATAGLVLPSVIIIGIIAALLSGFSDVPAVKSAFIGIRACVAALVLHSVIRIFNSASKDLFYYAAFVVCLALALFTTFPAAVIILAAGCAGVISGAVIRRNGK